MPPPDPDFVLLYDAICPLCVSAVEKLRRRGLLEGVEARPTADVDLLGLSPEDAESVRSEILLRDVQGGRSIRGFDAIIHLLAAQGRHPWLVSLGSTEPLRTLGRAAYKLVAFNRRLLSPPATQGIACACDPPPRPLWRLALLAVLLAVLAVSLCVFGLSVSLYQPASALRLALEASSAGFTAWLVPSALTSLTMPRRWRDIFWQGLVAATLGALTLLAFAATLPALHLLGPAGKGLAFWGGMGLAAAAARTALSLVRRSRNLGLPGKATLLWIAAHVGIWALAAAWLDLLGLRG